MVFDISVAPSDFRGVRFYFLDVRRSRTHTCTPIAEILSPNRQERTASATEPAL